MEIEDYNKETKKFLKDLGLKVSALIPVLKSSSDSISQRLNGLCRRRPISQKEFYKIITYFKNKSSEIYSKHIYIRQSKD